VNSEQASAGARVKAVGIAEGLRRGAAHAFASRGFRSRGRASALVDLIGRSVLWVQTRCLYLNPLFAFKLFLPIPPGLKIVINPWWYRPKTSRIFPSDSSTNSAIEHRFLDCATAPRTARGASNCFFKTHSTSSGFAPLREAAGQCIRSPVGEDPSASLFLFRMPAAKSVLIALALNFPLHQAISIPHHAISIPCYYQIPHPSPEYTSYTTFQ
jgi:hypothetical protein